MKYLGSKRRIARDILPIILASRKPEQWYVEPFCGGCNLIDKVPQGAGRIANDANKYLIAMFQGLQQGLNKPLDIPKEIYAEARTSYNTKSNTLSDFLIGWVGWMGSFNGRFFDGGYSGKTATRDYIDEQIRNTLEQLPNLLEISFVSGSYEDLVLPQASLIYCDIPYKDTKQYATSKNFDYRKFYLWCVAKKEEGHTIFVSEYAMPEDFTCIWQKEITNSMNTTKTYKPIEKLFTLI